MKRLAIVAVAALVAGPALAEQSCQLEAGAKKLAGAALASFMKKCEGDAAAKCDKAAAEKKLAGAAKASFTKKCVADATGTAAAAPAAPAAAAPAAPAAKPAAK